MRGTSQFAAFVLPALLAAAPAPKRPPVQPSLLPGEALALAGPDREVFTFGDTGTESPMGGLSHLLWAKLEGDAWSSGDMLFRCEGKMGPYHCTTLKGHGRVDVPKAFQESCNLAFMGWARMSAQRWEQDYGDGASRARMLDVFGPFLGQRLPDGEGVPELDMNWFGEGDLLRTSPEALAHWLLDPAQEQSIRLYRRLVLNFFDGLFKDNAWWVDPESAPTGTPGTYQAWAVGGNGAILAVLRLPPGTTRADAQARFMAILVGSKAKVK